MHTIPGSAPRWGRLVLAVVLLAGALIAVVDPAAVGHAAEPPSGVSTASTVTYAEATRMPAVDWRARQDAFLAAATAGPLDPTEPESLIAFAERGRRDPGFDGDLSAATAATFADILGRGLNDDFTVSTLLTLYVSDHDLLDPGLAAAIKRRLLRFKYWWTEPTRPGRIDRNYYWTENHQILFAADEYLAGQAFPDDVFTNSGMTGRQHQAHALRQVRRWIELRGRYGFSEFLSNPYTALSFEGVLSLAELADDTAVAELASQVLDLMLVEVASHLHDGVLGSAKGRTYTGNLFNPYGGTTPALIALVFGRDTPPTGSGPATAMAVANRYRPPEVAQRIAASAEEVVVRQHQGIALDPLAPVSDRPVAPDGLSFSGNDGLVVWWGMGAQLSWQVAPLSVRTIERYNLWNTPNFLIAGANVLEPIVAGRTPAQLRVLARSLAWWLNPGLLSAVNTYTWRSPDAMLSTAQDWRAGQRTESALISQATLDDAATVFTTLPKGPPLGSEGSGGGYWSGDGAAPRAVQHDNTTISIYAPQYPASGVDGPDGYAGYTHAMFPTERFDQVVRRDGWTFGRKGDGYVALWSWRPTRWRAIDPAVAQPGDLTQRYELVANGGPDNVWVTHVGRAADHQGVPDPFAAFVDVVAEHPPVVRPMAGARRCPASTPATLGSCDHGPGDGFQVRFGPPGQSRLGFGWSPEAAVANPPLTVDGAVVPIDDPTHRWASPWASAGRNGRYHVAIEGNVLDLTLPVPAR